MTKIDSQNIEFRVERGSIGEGQISSSTYYNVQT